MKKLILYIKRVLTNTGPHGRYCKCSKWGHYAALGCPNLNLKYKLYIHEKVS